VLAGLAVREGLCAGAHWHVTSGVLFMKVRVAVGLVGLAACVQGGKRPCWPISKHPGKLVVGLSGIMEMPF